MADPVDASKSAAQLSKLGAAKGGRARRDSLSKEERRQIASAAATARWDPTSQLPKATHDGSFRIADRTIACAVLETRKRVLTQETFLTAVGRSSKAKAGTGSTSLVDGLPPFLVASNLKPFISDELMASTTPVVFRTLTGGRAFGYDALLLPAVCEVYLKARDANQLLTGQEHIAAACDLLMRGLARVGIIAIVDEATGYQSDRARDELNKILEAYISKGLLPWTRRFPNEFFKQLYRVHGWSYREGQHKHTSYVGRFIKERVYEQLPPGVLEELERMNPVMESGHRRHQHHRNLTPATGHVHLDRQIIEVTTLMKVSPDKQTFKDLFDRAFSKEGDQLLLLPPSTSETS